VTEYGYHSGEPCCTHAYLLPAVVRALGAPSGPVLDIGCGNGAVARSLISLGHDVYGVDASESGVAEANASHPGGRFFVADVQSGRLPDALPRQFAAVLSTEVIEHLYDPRGMLDFARSVLVPGGRLIVSTPYHGYLKDLVLAMTGKLDAHHTVLWDGGHIKFFSRKTLEQMLSEQGFTPTRFEGAGRIPYLWKSMVVTAVQANDVGTSRSTGTVMGSSSASPT
jgi:2-polyprenyl-3-methyl-5-hydroxy-6-metoxy-1,4-benzoquinol methylase